jgi:hypothetical protein
MLLLFLPRLLRCLLLSLLMLLRLLWSLPTMVWMLVRGHTVMLLLLL